MRYFIRTLVTVVTLTLLLLTITGTAHACQANSDPGHAAPGSTQEEEPGEDAGLICLALVAATALLAGVAWVKRIRWLLP